MNVLAWPLTALALVFMYPWARWLINAPTRRFGIVLHSRVLIVLTTLALSVGTLSVVMLWLGLLGIRIDWRLVAIFCAAISVMGWIVWLRTKPAYEFPRLESLGWWNWPILIIAILCLLILFNAAYWPFGIDDAVTIYATFGKQTATTGQLPQGNLYETYPMLVPLTYAFTHQAAGWVDEHLAALIPAILSLGVVGVAYLLALADRLRGIIAALLIALTPMFTHWASASYVDLPAGFFYGLSAYFLLRLESTERRSDALLAGIMAGLAAWTKNSGLLIVISLAAWGVYRQRYWNFKRTPNPFFRYIAFIVGGFVIVAAPWYIRNLNMAGVIVPPTGWTWNAQRTLANLFPYIVDNRYFPIGWIFTAGLFYAIWRFARKGEDALLVIFYAPFFVIWWMLFSYDGRFLLTVTPFIAVMGARVVDTVINFIARLQPSPPALLPQERGARERVIEGKRRAVSLQSIAGILVIVVLAIPAASAAVDHKGEVLRNPFMSEADKHRVRLGADRYDMAIYLRTLPPGSRVWTQDLLLPYQADGAKMTVGGWPSAADLAGYDYWVLSPGEAPPEWLRGEPVHVEGGYRLYALTQ
jgi:hypothetical protein